MDEKAGIVRIVGYCAREPKPPVGRGEKPDLGGIDVNALDRLNVRAGNEESVGERCLIENTRVKMRGTRWEGFRCPDLAIGGNPHRHLVVGYVGRCGYEDPIAKGNPIQIR